MVRAVVYVARKWMGQIALFDIFKARFNYICCRGQIGQHNNININVVSETVHVFTHARHATQHQR